MQNSVALEDALLSGLPIGAGQRADCDICGAELRPNDQVEVVAWLISGDVGATARCLECSKGSIIRGTEGATEWLARGRLAPTLTANGRSELVLSGASVVDKSGP